MNNGNRSKHVRSIYPGRTDSVIEWMFKILDETDSAEWDYVQEYFETYLAFKPVSFLDSYYDSSLLLIKDLQSSDAQFANCVFENYVLPMAHAMKAKENQKVESIFKNMKAVVHRTTAA
ncbi:MAG: hypothetical protein AB8E15_07315 [Bdellovibrionales bacterium]